MTITALSLVGEIAHDLARGDSRTLVALDALHAAGGIDLLVLGADSVGTARGAASRYATVDPVTVAVSRHRRFARWGFVAVGSVVRDHPYNLARRLLSAHHLTDGRIGLALAADDSELPLDGGGLPWVPGRGPEPIVVSDAAIVIRELWNSWPAGTILGDRESGLYAEVDRVRRVRSEGSFSIEGPLNTPASERGELVLASWGVAQNAWAELAVDADRITAGGVVVARVVTTRRTSELPQPGAGAAAEVSGGLRGILGLTPRSLDLSDYPVFAGAAAAPRAAALRS